MAGESVQGIADAANVPAPKRQRAFVRVIVAGIDVSSRINPRLMELTILDKRDTDNEAHLVLDDRLRHPSHAHTGATARRSRSKCFRPREHYWCLGSGPINLAFSIRHQLQKAIALGIGHQRQLWQSLQPVDATQA
jgi:hypothetical protein